MKKNSNQQTKVVTDWGHHTPPQWFQSNRGLTEIPESDSQRRGRGSMWMKESCTNCKIKLPKCREGSMTSCFSFHIQPKKGNGGFKKIFIFAKLPSKSECATHSRLYSQSVFHYVATDTTTPRTLTPNKHWPPRILTPNNTDLQQTLTPMNTDRQKINYWLIN